jgi:hypothetical protein
LEAEALESLELKDCTLQHFGLVSEGRLCILRIKDACFSEFGHVRGAPSQLC